MQQNRVRLASLLFALAGAKWSACGQAVTSAFTYQGDLRDQGLPVEGFADLEFSIWSAASGGAQIGATQTALSVSIVNGRFAVPLNAGGEFGINPFDGQKRWLQIAVRSTNSGGVFTSLSPRQELTATPYAAYALSAATLGGQSPAFFQNAANLTGALPDARLSNNVPLRSSNQTFSGSNTFTGANLFNNTNNTYLGNGAGITALNASNITAGTLPDARLSANVALLNGLNTFTAPTTFQSTTLFGNSIGVGLPNSSAFRLQLSGGSGPWRGGVAAGGSSNATVLGELNSFATLGGHNGLLSAWAPLIINPTGTALGIGTGTTAPVAPVHISNASFSPLLVESNNPAGTWFNLRNSSTGGTHWHLISSGSGNGGGAGRLLIGTGASHNSSNGEVLSLASTGQVGVGTVVPAATFHVFNGSDASLVGGGHIISGDTAGLNVVMDNNEIIARNNGAPAPLYLNQGSGNVIVPVLEITGGSDVAEPYDVAATAGVEPIAGMVVAIDPDDVGKMRVVSGAYDRTVAGIISGANGIKPGITLTQTGTIADGDMPVASIGRVWCWCDADQGGPITAGDMLTTSDTPGHAMKVNDHARSQGATLGKAMSSLESGKGLVLVLVSLQ
jgi:hypothetical protein